MSYADWRRAAAAAVVIAAKQAPALLCRLLCGVGVCVFVLRREKRRVLKFSFDRETPDGCVDHESHVFHFLPVPLKQMIEKLGWKMLFVDCTRNDPALSKNSILDADVIDSYFRWDRMIENSD